MKPSRVILYGTEPCSLCERASALLEPVARRLQIPVEHCDIAHEPGCADLETRIPLIVRRDTGAELAWPFTAESLYRFFM